MAEDRLQGDLQQTRHETQLAEMRARDADRAAAALEATTADTRRITGEITDLQAKLDRIKNTPPPAPVMLPPESPRVDPRQSRQAEALAQDLRGKLSRFGVSLPVEVRAARDGRQRVAIVLENSFKAGDDSLATNMDAVRAIVNLGKLINEAYPGSRVTVEGHTDSDPISKSGKRWRDNEHLSLARAEAVRTALTKAGVSAGSVTVVGHGARYPIAPGKSDRAKSRNRRVEIYVEPSA
jgi:flagellar motor protein MotB